VPFLVNFCLSNKLSP